MGKADPRPNTRNAHIGDVRRGTTGVRTGSAGTTPGVPPAPAANKGAKITRANDSKGGTSGVQQNFGYKASGKSNPATDKARDAKQGSAGAGGQASSALSAIRGTANDRDGRSASTSAPQSQPSSLSQRTTTAPSVNMPPVQLITDAKGRTNREQLVDAWNRDFSGTSGGKQFETVYEENVGKIDVVKGGTATKSGYRKNKVQ